MTDGNNSMNAEMIALQQENINLMRQIESMKPFVCTKIVCKDREKTRYCPCCGQKI